MSVKKPNKPLSSIYPSAQRGMLSETQDRYHIKRRFSGPSDKPVAFIKIVIFAVVVVVAVATALFFYSKSGFSNYR